MDKKYFAGGKSILLCGPLGSGASRKTDYLATLAKKSGFTIKFLPLMPDYDYYDSAAASGEIIEVQAGDLASLKNIVEKFAPTNQLLIHAILEHEMVDMLWELLHKHKIKVIYLLPDEEEKSYRRSKCGKASATADWNWVQNCVTYMSPETSLDELKIRVQYYDSLFSILSLNGGDDDDANQERGRILTLYFAGVDLSKQVGFAQHKQLLENYAKTIKSGLSKNLSQVDVLVNLVISYI